MRPCNDLCLVKHCTKALPTFISVESAAVFLFWAVSLWEKKDVFCNSLTHFQVYFIVDISVDQWERSVFSWSELWLVKLPLWADHSPLLQSFIINVSLFKASLKKQHSCSFTLASFSSTNTVLLALLSGVCRKEEAIFCFFMNIQQQQQAPLSYRNKSETSCMWQILHTLSFSLFSHIVRLLTHTPLCPTFFTRSLL